MIVICEHCDTRFKLDEGRIPPGGARVRCSRCKHAFFLPAPGGDEPDLLDELTSQTAAEPQPAPQPTEEPGDGLSHRGPAAPEAPTASPGEPEVSESDWEFSEGVPGEDDGDGSKDLSSDRIDLDAGVPPPPPEPSGLALGGGPEVSPPEAAPTSVDAAPAPHPPIEAPSADEDLMSWAFEEDDPVESAAPPARSEVPLQVPPKETGPETLTPAAPSELLEAPEGVGRVLEATGWLATAVFAGLVTVQLLLQATPEARTAVSEQPIGPLVAESIRGRFVENLFVGPLLVVTTHLRNPGDAPTSLGAVVRAVLVDAEGDPIGGSPAALAPAAEREVREQPPEVLASRLAERARTLSAQMLAPGERIGLTAVFPAGIGEAEGLSLEMDPRSSQLQAAAGTAAGPGPSEQPPAEATEGAGRSRFAR